MKTSFGEYFDDQRDRMIQAMQNKNTQLWKEWREDFDKRQKPDYIDEYDFTNGVRGKYADKYHRETNVVVLEPDIAKLFPNSESVNQALRSLHAIQSIKS